MDQFEQLCRAAAVERAQHVRARADRPSQRRDGVDAGEARAHAKITAFEFREERTAAGVDILQFEGYASVTETPYEMYDFWGPYTEVIERGAFAPTLAQTGLDVPLVLQHNDLRRIARTTAGSLTLSEDEHGLLTRADLNPADLDVQYIRQKMVDHLIDEMSFKFRIVAGVWSPDYTEYRIKEVDINRGDVAIVGYGANPYTAGATISTTKRDSIAPTIKRGLDLITDEDIAIRLR